MSRRHPFTTVCRSCTAEIRMVPTPANWMPVDPDPVAEGNVAIRSGVAHTLAGEQLALAQRLHESLYLSHFATCPFADRHRKR